MATARSSALVLTMAETQGASSGMRKRSVLRHWRLPLAAAVLLALLQASGLRGALQYQRAAVLHGQVWRLLTGSLVHLSWLHLTRDLAGLFLIWGLFAHALNERTWLAALLGSTLAVGLGLLAFDPGIAWYVGVSGSLFGMFCAGALYEYGTRPLYASALLLGMSGVIVWTLVAGGLPGETDGLGGNIVPQAHLYGALGGAAFVLVRGAFRTRRAAAGEPAR